MTWSILEKSHGPLEPWVFKYYWAADSRPLLYTTSLFHCIDASSVEDAQDAARKPFFYSISIASVCEDSTETQGVINGSRDTQGLINGGQ